VHVHEARNDDFVARREVLRVVRDANFVAMAHLRDLAVFHHNHAVKNFFVRSEDAAGVNGGRGHGSFMLPELAAKNTSEPCILFLLRYNHGARKIQSEWNGRRFGGICMAYDKRYVAQKRQRRRRKTAKAKMHLYEQGKLPHDKLPALAKKFLSRKTRALKRAS